MYKEQQEQERREQERQERFAKILTAWIEEKKLSQRKAAKLLGVSASAIRAWVNCENAVNWKDFINFAIVLGKTPECLLAEVRGVAVDQMPAKLPFQDIERIVSELPLEDRKKLIHFLVESL